MERWRYYLVESSRTKLTIVATSKELAEQIGRKILGVTEPYQGELSIEEEGPAMVQKTRVLERLEKEG